jgi:hypothetical protein
MTLVVSNNVLPWVRRRQDANRRGKTKGTCGLPAQVAVGKLSRADGLKVFAAKVQPRQAPTADAYIWVRLEPSKDSGRPDCREQP